MMTNRYLEITKLLNRGKLRVIIASGQAVVLNRLAIMSKDCDWIIREELEAFEYVLNVLSDLGAVYRFGAPLDVNWHKFGWSSHFEITERGQRLRLDFFSRPPRITERDLSELWKLASEQPIPFVDRKRLIKQKMTDRLKDYAVIGEIVRSLNQIETTLMYSQSASDLLRVLKTDSTLHERLREIRPVFATIDFNSAQLELDIRLALETERYDLMKVNLARIASYKAASKKLALIWPEIERKTLGMKLNAAHDIILAEAEIILPKTPNGT